MRFSTKRPRIFYIQLQFQEPYLPLLSQALGKAAKCKQPRGLYFPHPELSLSHTFLQRPDTTFFVSCIQGWLTSSRRVVDSQVMWLKLWNDPESPESLVPASPPLFPFTSKQKAQWAAVLLLLPKKQRRGFLFPLPPIVAQNVGSEKILASLM